MHPMLFGGRLLLRSLQSRYFFKFKSCFNIFFDRRITNPCVFFNFLWKHNALLFALRTNQTFNRVRVHFRQHIPSETGTWLAICGVFLLVLFRKSLDWCLIPFLHWLLLFSLCDMHSILYPLNRFNYRLIFIRTDFLR